MHFLTKSQYLIVCVHRHDHYLAISLYILSIYSHQYTQIVIKFQTKFIFKGGWGASLSDKFFLFSATTYLVTSQNCLAHNNIFWVRNKRWSQRVPSSKPLGPVSELPRWLVNVLLKLQTLISQICQYFLLKK